jgi:hypothetical protein
LRAFAAKQGHGLATLVGHFDIVNAVPPRQHLLHAFGEQLIAQVRGL